MPSISFSGTRLPPVIFPIILFALSLATLSESFNSKKIKPKKTLKNFI